MKRSAHPLPWGSRTKAGLLAIPRKRSSVWKWALMNWLAWGRRGARPGGVARGLWGEVRPSRYPEEAHLGLERVAHDLAAVVMPERQAGRDARAVAVEV